MGAAPCATPCATPHRHRDGGRRAARRCCERERERERRAREREGDARSTALVLVPHAKPLRICRCLGPAFLMNPNVWFLAAGRRAATRLKRRRTWPGQLRVRSPDRCHRRPVTRANAAHQTQPLTQPQPSRDQALGGRGVLRPSRHPPPRPAPSAPPRPSCKAKKEKKKDPRDVLGERGVLRGIPRPAQRPGPPKAKGPKLQSCKAKEERRKIPETSSQRWTSEGEGPLSACMRRHA